LNSDAEGHGWFELDRGERLIHRDQDHKKLLVLRNLEVLTLGED
jgi:hypothetical protein